MNLRALAAALLVLAAAPVSADSEFRIGGRTLTSFERQAVRSALDRLGLVVEPEPEGKPIARFIAVTLPVFARDGRFSFLNYLHVDTSTSVIIRDQILVKGEKFTWLRANEARRRLRIRNVTGFAVVVPVQSKQPGAVDVLVVTQDLWSLRLNSDFEVRDGKLTDLVIRPSENNFLGWRKQVGLLFELTQGSYAVGPLYKDPNVFGKRLVLEASAALVFGRESGSGLEGSQSSMSFGYPLWSFETPWGAQLTTSHFDGVVRRFQGDDLLEFDDPDTPVIEEVPVEYGLKRFTSELSGTRQLGHDIKHRVSAGHRLRVEHPEVLPSFQGTDEVRRAFVDEFLPIDERSSLIFGRYQLLLQDFAIYRNVDTFDLPEDFPMGLALTAEIGGASSILRSDRSFASYLGSVSYLHAFRDWFARGELATSGRRESDRFTERRTAVEVRAISPVVLGWFRAVVRTQLAQVANRISGDFLQMGGDTGLRGYPVGAFVGETAAIGNLELRSRPLELDKLRYGAVVFYDLGHAAERFGDLSPRHDVGVGLRVLIPELGVNALRVDWAYPFSSRDSGFIGRVSVGLGQAF